MCVSLSLLREALATRGCCGLDCLHAFVGVPLFSSAAFALPLACLERSLCWCYSSHSWYLILCTRVFGRQFGIAVQIACCAASPSSSYLSRNFGQRLCSGNNGTFGYGNCFRATDVLRNFPKCRDNVRGFHFLCCALRSYASEIYNGLSALRQKKLRQTLTHEDKRFLQLAREESPRKCLPCRLYRNIN